MKAQLQLFARKYGSPEWILLDLFEAEPVRLNLRVQDVIEPTLTVASYSQTFRVPHSYINGKFFKQIFSVNQTVFDPSKKAQAYLNSEGQFYMNGNIQLLNVFRNEQTGGVEYEIVFVNELSDFASQIGLGTGSDQQGGYLSNLDVSSYTHDKNRANVTGSWSRNLFGGDLVYPLVEWGYNYTGSGNSTQPSIPTLATTGTKAFTDSNNPLNIGQMKPAMRVKAIWDKIFDQTEYTYESNFLNTNQFKDLYLIADKESRAEINTTMGLNLVYNGFSYQSNFGANTSPIMITPANVLFDLGSNYNTNGQVFNVTADGFYSFNLRIDYSFFTAASGNEIFTFYLRQGRNDTSPIWPGSQDFYFFPGGTTTGIVTLTTPTLNFVAGDRIYFWVQMINLDQNTDYFFNNSNLTTAVTPGDLIIPNNLLPDNIKQIDFIKSVSEKFKLVFEPTFQDEKKFYIEPWSEWIKGGITRDWTSKLNAAKDYKLTPLFQSQNRFMTFKDEEDSDYVNYNYQQAFKQTYGQLNRDSFIEILRDTKEVKSIFAPLPIAPLGYAAGASAADVEAAEKWLIPHIAKDEVTKDGPGKRTPIQPKLRLGYYNGLTGAPKTWYLVNTDPINEYPLMSSYWPNPWDTSSISLDWTYSPPQWDTSYTSNPSGRAKTYNFDEYWSKWYYSCYGETNITLQSQSLDKDFSYIFEGEFILDYKDLVDLRFNDKIFVKDAYYLVNSISGFSPHEKSPCKVVLYKLNNIGVQLPGSFLPMTDICYAPTSVCDAACCLFNTPISSIFSTDAPNLTGGSLVFLNAAGTVPGLSGYYSNGTNVYTVGATGGLVTAVTPIASAGCECVPELDPLSLCFFPGTGTFCEACCCQGATGDIWMENNGATWYQNTYYFANSTGGAAPTGWYSNGTNFVYVNEGIPEQSGSCNPCNCDIYDLTTYGGCTGPSLCAAVCCTGPAMQNWFGNEPDLAACTFLYGDQIGTPVANGWYFDGEDVVQVTGGTGAVTAVGDPSTCLPCSNETNNYYFDFFSTVSGTGAFAIEKSLDSVVWIPEYSKDISTITAGATFNYTGPLAPNTFLRGTLTYGAAHTTGTFRTSIEQTNSTINLQNTVRFGNYTSTPINASVTGAEVRFSVNLTGTVYDCALTGGTAWKCVTPSCNITGGNSVYVIDNDFTACCDPLYVDNGGYGFVANGTFFIDGNCTGPGPEPCYECNGFINGSYNNSDFHQYNPHYICDSLSTDFISGYYEVYDRPNRFTWYDDGGFITTSGWVGFANYPGPWGPSLSTPTSGILTAPYTSGNGLYLLVEAGPADPLNPLTDSYSVTISCSTSCYYYTNNSFSNWTGDWLDCNSVWHYAETVAPLTSICAVVGTPFTIYGTDLTQTTSCIS
jgi:hypothetical protein